MSEEAGCRRGSGKTTLGKNTTDVIVRPRDFQAHTQGGGPQLLGATTITIVGGWLAALGRCRFMQARLAAVQSACSQQLPPCLRLRSSGLGEIVTGAGAAGQAREGSVELRPYDWSWCNSTLALRMIDSFTPRELALDWTRKHWVWLGLFAAVGRDNY